MAPRDVRLGAMPPTATTLMRRIAQDMRLRLGLRLAVDDDRPLPYATSEAVNAGFCRHKNEASRAIRRLVAAGVIDDAGALPPRRGVRDGTKLYAAPTKTALERGAVVVEAAHRPPVKPPREVEDEALVDRAEPVALVNFGVPAAGDRAHAEHVGAHDTDDIAGNDGALRYRAKRFAPNGTALEVDRRGHEPGMRG